MTTAILALMSVLAAVGWFDALGLCWLLTRTTDLLRVLEEDNAVPQMDWSQESGRWRRLTVYHLFPLLLIALLLTLLVW